MAAGPGSMPGRSAWSRVTVTSAVRAIGLPYKASGNSSSVISSGRDAAVAACLGALLDPASAGGPARVTPERAFGSGTCLRDRLTKAAAIT